jgi:hypothetical protein
MPGLKISLGSSRYHRLSGILLMLMSDVNSFQGLRDGKSGWEGMISLLDTSSDVLIHACVSTFM